MRKWFKYSIKFDNLQKDTIQKHRSYEDFEKSMGGYKENKFYSQGSILCKFQNKSLAEKIWGVKDDGETWQCMYFFKEIKEISIDIKEFNKLLSYGEENKIFKFRVLDENKSNLIIQHFKL